MFDVEESPIPVRKREQVPSMAYPPTVLSEYIKCVVVGDSGVGKTHLITTWACNTSHILEQLVKTHVSTVWAHDHYRQDQNILNQSVVAIDGGFLALRLWDTFGYHDKDRGFAYRGADVVLLCYSVAMPRSLNNLKKIWIPEIRRRAPATPVVVVGCQADLRYLYRDEHYQKIDKGLMYRVVQEKDISTPEQGRAMAKEIGAPYYECSAYNNFGVEDVFHNVIRAAMVEKRKIKFWSSMLRRIQYPQIQAPMKLPPLQMPKVNIADSSLHKDLSSLLDNKSEGDVVFIVHGHKFEAHKICLAIAAKVFEHLFIETDVIRTEHVPKLQRSFSSQNPVPSNANVNSSTSMDNIRKCESMKDKGDYSSTAGARQGHSVIPMHSAFLTMDEVISDPSCTAGQDLTHTVITVRSEITAMAFRVILQYLYTGTISNNKECFDEVLLACGLLQLTDLAVMISNITTGEEYLNAELQSQFQLYRNTKLHELALKREKLTDIRFLVDDGAVRAHKPLLMARCEMMYAMFNDNFMEASAASIVLPCITRDVFLAVREFLYTGDCPAAATLNCLGIIEAADRLCLPRLLTLVESAVIDDLTAADREGEDIIEDVMRLLQPAQLHNAGYLSGWCVRYLCNHFLVIRQKYQKLFYQLSPENTKFIEKNRWPPEWYIKELRYFDDTHTQSLKAKRGKRNFQQKQQFSRWDQCTSAAGCLCFCRRSKISMHQRDNDSFDISE